MTTPAQFQKIRECVHELVDLDAAAQAERLQRLHAEDPVLAAAVAELLGRIEPEDMQPAIKAMGPVPGQRVGPFELVELIGSGGMGVVYRAQRVDGAVVQTVAIKLPGRSLLMPQEERRLKRERDLLARLEHPHIARLVDAGAEPGVGPWFAMEFVQGIAITRYADAQRLGIRARLELWLQLAEAVIYAHQHLIVHRDLKPANVLVDASGQVKLLDFGVANLFTPDSEANVSLQAFTPRYASPEQIAGEPITTATDVHGLGLLLYELLCARQAFPEQGDLALRQAIATTEPPSMRSALTRLDAEIAQRAGQARALTRAQWLRALGGELEAIVARSLRKRPDDRYASASDFADDVRSYLEGGKVAAMAPSWRYRTAKFVRRHRGLLAASALVAAAIGIGLLTTLQQRDRARAAELQMRAENGLLVEVLGGGPDYAAGGADMRVRDLLRSAAHVVANRQDLAPVSRARLLHTLAEGLLSLLDDAEADAALAAAQQALSEVPGAAADLALRLQLKRSWIGYEAGQRDLAMQQTQTLWPAIERTGGAVLLEALQNRAHFHAGMRAFEQAYADLQTAQLLALSMQPRPERDLSQIRYNRIHVLMNLQRNDEAYALAQEHIAIAESRPPDFINARITATEMLARAASKVDRSAEAEARLLAILPAVESLYQGRGNRLAGIVGALASAQRASGRFRAAAEQHLRQAALRQEMLPDSIYVASALRFAGVSLHRLGDVDSALAQLRRARALFDRLGSPSEVLYCDLYIAAAQFQQERSAASLQALQKKVDEIVATGEASDRIEAPVLMVEAALLTGSSDVANRYLQFLHGEMQRQSTGRGIRAHVAVLNAELAQQRGETVDTSGLHNELETLGNVYLLARFSDMQVLRSTGSNRMVACQQAEQAWARVDAQGLAWRNLPLRASCALASSRG
jgi:eukaryotic-like serine/threonine-protein kinase